jgi:hypothetical protein
VSIVHNLLINTSMKQLVIRKYLIKLRVPTAFVTGYYYGGYCGSSAPQGVTNPLLAQLFRPSDRSLYKKKTEQVDNHSLIN